MDLYISPLSCSFAAHVACREAGIPIELHRVDRKTKHLEDGRDFRTVAPQAIVPAIGLGDGAVLTEMAAVLQFVADQAPASELAPPWGTRERYRLVEWIHFVSTEIHKKHLWMVFSSKTPDAVKEWARTTASPPLAYVAAHLGSRDYLLGDRFTVADAYLFWALFVAPHGGITLGAWPALEAYVKRIQSRPSVQAALAIEGPLFAKEVAAGNAPAPRAQPSV